MIYTALLFSSLAFGQGSTLNTAPTKELVKAKPVPGSRVLLTGFDVKEGSAAQFIIQQFVSLEKQVLNYDQMSPAQKTQVDAQIRKIVSNVLDLDYLGRRAMLAYWDKVEALPEGKAKLDEYLQLFKKLVEGDYLEKARTYVSGEYQIPLMEEEVGSKFTFVRGKIKRADVDLLLEFKMLKDPYRVVDVKLDETSLESTYRGSFNRIIRDKDKLAEGFNELLRVMRLKLDEIEKGGATRL